MEREMSSTHKYTIWFLLQAVDHLGSQNDNKIVNVSKKFIMSFSKPSSKYLAMIERFY